jgi:hypothetical protein
MTLTKFEPLTFRKQSRSDTDPTAIFGVVFSEAQFSFALQCSSVLSCYPIFFCIFGNLLKKKHRGVSVRHINRNLEAVPFLSLDIVTILAH